MYFKTKFMKTQNTKYKIQNLNFKVFVIIILSLSAISSFGQGTTIDDDPKRPRGCYFLSTPAGRTELVDQCVPCALPELMRLVDPPELCADILELKNNYGCCPICWIVIDPQNMTLLVNYLRSIYFGRGWTPVGDNTGLGMFLTSVDTSNVDENGTLKNWGIYIPKSKQFVISSTEPIKSPLYKDDGTLVSYIIEGAVVNNGRINISNEELHSMILTHLEANPCST